MAVAAVRIPRDAIESSIEEIWEDLLELPSIDTQASFFSLGGDATLARAMLDRVADILGRRVPLEAFLRTR